MTRGLPTDVETALAQPYVSIVTFAKLEFPSGTIYVHNSIGTYSWVEGGSSRDWLGVGDLGSISQVEEGQDVSPYAITLTLSGLEPDITGAALTENYFMHGVTVYLGVLDSSDELIDTPSPIWAGFMDQMTITVGADDGDAIQLTAESELSRFDQSANLMYTNAAQQEKSSTDLFYSHMHKIEDAKIAWGSKKPGSTGVPGIDEDDTKVPDRMAPF